MLVAVYDTEWATMAWELIYHYSAGLELTKQYGDLMWRLDWATRGELQVL